MITCRLRLDCGGLVSDVVAELTRSLAEQGGLTPSQAYGLRLALDEITTNIAQHGYAGNGGIVDLLAGVEPGEVWVRVEDDAPPFDPRDHDPAPRLAAHPHLRPEGGYGLFLALNKLDDFAYDHAGGRNRNTLIMHRPVADQEAG